NQDPQHPNSFIIKTDNQKLLGLVRTDKNGTTYWKFKERNKKKKVIKENDPQSSPVADNIQKFQQRQSKSQERQNLAENQLNPHGNNSNAIRDLNGSLSALKPDNSETTKLITYALVATAIVGIFGALNSFYDEKLKDTIENKSSEYKDLASEFIAKSLNYQKAMLAIGLGIFLLLTIAYF
ncbi:7354_t:CDS:2, partial [Ambispora gerdemannii]